MNTDAISDIVKFKDVNKSTIFLYELLQIKIKSIVPINTYMGVSGCIIFKDTNLICLFHEGQEGFKEIDTELRSHEQFDLFVDDPEGYRYYVMDFSETPDVYKLIKEGKYSQLPKNAKDVIILSKHPVGWIGVDPKTYYEEFSYEYNVPIEKLEKDVELLDPPCMINEMLNLPDKIREMFVA